MSTVTTTYSWPWIAGGAVVLYVIKQLTRPKLPAPLPPGPKGLPIVGKALQWPKEKSWELFTLWGKTYGDIVYANLFGQHAVILNDPVLAVELLDHKSSTYSDRPLLYVAGELAEYKHTLALMQYGKPMRQLRNLITRAIGSKTSLTVYGRMQEIQVHRFIRDVLNQPDRLTDHAHKLAGAIILSIVYGYQVKEGQDDLITVASQAMYGFGAATTPGQFLVDVFPSIDLLPSWFPGLNYRQFAADMWKKQHEFLNKPFQYTQDQLRAGTALPSFVATHVTHKDVQEMTPEFEHLIKWGALTMFGGGFDTTLSSFQTFFLAMTLNPRVQVKARMELDSILGHGHLPRIGDRKRLPYAQAVYLEVLRWSQVLPQGVAHVSREDDIHRGYFIPKGTIVVPNIWKFTHDSTTYPGPMSFKPERFLKGDNHDPEADPREYVFGYGRRISPGRQLAEQSIWLVCATSLATLSVSKQIGPDGRILEPKVEYVGHLITHPKDFPCQIEARSQQADDLIRHAAQESTEWYLIHRRFMQRQHAIQNRLSTNE